MKIFLIPLESQLPVQSEKNIYLYAPFFAASLTQQISKSILRSRSFSLVDRIDSYNIYKNVRGGLGNLAALSSVSGPPPTLLTRANGLEAFFQ